MTGSIEEEERSSKLDNYTESAYYENGGWIHASLSSQKLALLGITSGDVLVAVGVSSHSKGMLDILEEHVLGAKNHSDVDPNVSKPPGGYRKSAHVMINNVDCAFKEGERCRKFASGIWGRVIVGDVGDMRRNDWKPSM